MPAVLSCYFTDNRVNLWREHQKDTPCGASNGKREKGSGGEGIDRIFHLINLMDGKYSLMLSYIRPATQ